MAGKIFSLEVLKARKGDCLLLHYGTKAEPGLALIDGGPTGVYTPFLRPRIEELRAERGIDDNDALPLDLVMLSHIDDDHIKGLIQLTGELVKDQDNNKPKLVQVLDLWHNTFDDLIDNDADELAGAVNHRFGPASLTGDLPWETAVGVDTFMVLANVPQGRQLRDDAIKLKIERNVEFDGALVIAASDSEPLDMGSGLALTVVGPMLPEVTNLQKAHDKWVKAHPEAVRASEQALAAYVDKSVPNLSSIVVLAEVKSGNTRKRILFTGDARGDKILEGLELVGLVDQGGTLEVDVLKCPHHGSSNNVEQDFFERIVADHYVFSGNGEHGNPERETLEMLAAARGDDDYRIHLTYPVDEIDVERKKDWEKLKKMPKWTAARNSLAAFFTKNPDVEAKVEIVEEGVPHTIDLLEKP